MQTIFFLSEPWPCLISKRKIPLLTTAMPLYAQTSLQILSACAIEPPEIKRS